MHWLTVVDVGPPHSLSTIRAYGHLGNTVQIWAYGFFAVQVLCVFWGCLGVSTRVSVGYKHVPEFWIAQFLFMSTSSALRAYNRILFACLIPAGSEVLFVGLEITLDPVTGWINPLMQGVIQNSTHNMRYPRCRTCFSPSWPWLCMCGWMWSQDVDDAQTLTAGRGDVVLVGERAILSCHT